MPELLRFPVDMSKLADEERLAVPLLDHAVSGIERIYRRQLSDAPGANLYPSDLTREEFRAALSYNDSLGRYDTVVRRSGSSGGLTAVPYQVEYHDDLVQIADYLYRASDLLAHTSFGDYVRARADSLQDGTYDRSDEMWLDVHDSNLQLVIGPIETYIDRFMAIKASYEGILAVRRPATDETFSKVTETARSLRDRLLADLPYAADGRMQIELDQVVVMAGHANANRMNAKTLPNSAAEIARKGSRKMLFTSVIEARTTQIFSPIVEALFAQPGSTHDAELRQGGSLFLLSHELWHTLFMPKGFSRPVVCESYTFLEEAKAHFLGLATIAELRARGAICEREFRAAVLAILGYLIADVRLGARLATRSAYKTAALLVLGRLEQQGCMSGSSAGRRVVDFDLLCDVAGPIAVDYCMSLVGLSYTGGRDLRHEAEAIEPSLSTSLDRLSSVPITI